MPVSTPRDQIFIKRLTEIVDANLSDENFGVNELAEKSGLSRSQIHRRLKKSTNKSLSQFIREIRLEKGKELLEKESLTVSEVAYKVGFGSPSYFIKSFHDYFGFPPGEYLKYASAETAKEDNATLTNENSEDKSFIKAPSVLNKKILIIVVIIAIVISGIFVVNKIGNKDLVIAVLVPKNLTGQDIEEHLIYGVQADLIGELSQLKELRVISQRSTLEIKDTTMGLLDIARKLNIDLLLAPGLISIGDNLEIVVNLIDAFPDEHNIQTKKYKTDIQNILQFYSLATRDIAQKLHLNLSEDVKKRHSQTRKVNPESRDAYYRGINCLRKDNPESFAEGIKHMRKAIDNDPTDPYAYAAAAIGYAIKGHHNSINSEEDFTKARYYANIALELDSTINKAKTAIALVKLYQEWDWHKAKEAFTEAIKINPSNAVAHAHFAWYYQVHGDFENAIFHAKKAVTLDPLYLEYNAWLGAIYYWAGEYDKAEILAKKVLAEKDSSLFSNSVLGWINLLSENYPEAIRLTEKLPNWDYWNLYRAYVYVRSGNREKALTFRNIMEENVENIMKENPEKEYVWDWQRGLMAAICGDKEDAFKYLNIAVDKKQYQVMYINWYPFTESIRSDPRYNDLLKKMNLPPYTPDPSE